MPKLTLIDLDRELRGKKLRPLYLIYGPENYLSATALSKIRAYVNTIALDENFQPERFSAKESKPLEIISAVSTLPMWSKHKLVIVSNADGLKDADEFVKYFKNPAGHATVIFTAEKADGRTKFVQMCTELGGVVECKPLYDSQVADWIRMETSHRGKTFSMEAARFMADIVGKNLGELSGAIEKLMLFVGKKPTIDLLDVETVLTETGEKSVFELSNAVGERDLKNALHIIKRLSDFGESEILTLNMLARHWRLLARTKEAATSDTAHLASLLHVSPFFAKDYLRQARSFSGKDIKMGFGELFKTDKALKSSKLPKWVVLEKCVRSLCSVDGKRQA